MNTEALERANEIKEELEYLQNYKLPLEKTLEKDSKFIPDLIIRLPNRIREGYSSFSSKDYTKTWNYLEKQNHIDEELAEITKQETYILISRLYLRVNRKIRKLERELKSL